MTGVDGKSDVKIYGVTPERMAKARQQLIIRSAIMWGIAMTLVVALMLYILSQDRSGSLVLIAAMVGLPAAVFLTVVSVGSIVFWYSILKKQLDSYSVTLGPDSITINASGINPVTVRRDEITRLA